MKKVIIGLVLAILLTMQLANAEERKDGVKQSGLNGVGTDFTVGYSNLLFDGVRSNGFDVGIALLNISNATGMNYGIDCSYSGFLKKGSDYQSILTIGPSVGIKFPSDCGYTFGIVVNSGIGSFRLCDKDKKMIEGNGFVGKSKISMGYKDYLIEFEGGYYTTSKYDFSTFAINFKLCFK